MRVGFTGTSQGMSQFSLEALAQFLRESAPTEFHHGDCVGADCQAHNVAVSLHVPRVIIHPPQDPKKRAWTLRLGLTPAFDTTVIERREYPYLVRNHHIVDETDMLVATPATRNEVLRSGTWATVRYARSLGRPVHLILPGVVGG